MKILVTGSNGFLGTALVRRYIERDEPATLRCMHRPGSDLSRLEKVRALDHRGQIELVVGTLNSRADCRRAVEGVDMIYHLAAALGGAPAEMFLNTVVSSRNLLDAAVEAKKRPKVVLVSSFGVYGMANVREGSTVTENTPLEPHPERRDLYSQAKLRQEKLFKDYQEAHGLPLVVLRPGVIYGPGGSAISNRVGLDFFGIFLHLGGKNLLPLSYVDNCADAVIDAGACAQAVGQIYNVHDDDLPQAKVFLKRYIKEVKRLRYLSLPFAATKLMSRLVEKYSAYSGGQLPAVFTPYKTDAMWRSFRYDNQKLKSIGWRQLIPTEEALARTFSYLKAQQDRGQP